jgi:hypothetical protein
MILARSEGPRPLTSRGIPQFGEERSFSGRQASTAHRGAPSPFTASVYGGTSDVNVASREPGSPYFGFSLYFTCRCRVNMSW